MQLYKSDRGKKAGWGEGGDLWVGVVYLRRRRFRNRPGNGGGDARVLGSQLKLKLLPVAKICSRQSTRFGGGEGGGAGGERGKANLRTGAGRRPLRPLDSGSPVGRYTYVAVRLVILAI